MKKYERILIYGIAILAILYGVVKRGELEMERGTNRQQLLYYLPYGEGEGRLDLAESWISDEDYDKMIVELVSNSLTKNTRKRLGDLLYFWAQYQNRWHYRVNVMTAQTKMELVKAELAESRAISKFCETEK